MKIKLYLICLFISSCVFAQSEVYFFKDTTGILKYKDVLKKGFEPVKNEVLEKYSNKNVYWFKIPKKNTNNTYVIKFLYERIIDADAYQNSLKLDNLANQRYLSYKFSRNNDVFIKIKPKLHSYIPFDLEIKDIAEIKEKKILLVNGFYYGFAFLVIVYNMFYFIIFKDKVFLYYSIFLASMSFGVFTMDGMLNFYDFSATSKNILMIVNYILLAFASSKFVDKYLFLSIYYPKIKKISFIIGYIIILSGLLFLFFRNYYFLLILNILVFSLLFIYWLISVILFNKNFYNKILTIGYVIILFSAIDFFILKFLGVSIINTNAFNIKIGAFLEMIILSIAVLYRMNTLKEENKFMRNEIVTFSKQFEKQNNFEKDNIDNAILKLSHRESEIFDLLVSGKSNKEIASELNISVNTVKFHVKNIYEKLKIKNRKEVQIISKS